MYIYIYIIDIYIYTYIYIYAYKLIKYMRFSLKPPSPFCPVKPQVFENLVGGSTPPPAERGWEGCTLCHSLVSSFTPIEL